MTARSELDATEHSFGGTELNLIVPPLYNTVRDMLLANPTFLRKSAETVLGEIPPDSTGWRKYTIPTKTDREVYEVHLKASYSSFAIRYIRDDTNVSGRSFVKDQIDVSLQGRAGYFPAFSSREGSCSQEGLEGFNKFVKTFKKQAR